MNIRSKTSIRALYHIDKERYLELKHFCLQYDSWKKELNNIDFFHGGSILEISHKPGKTQKDTVYDIVSKRALLRSNIAAVDKALLKAEENDIIRENLKECVIHGSSYAKLSMQSMIPCGRDMFYKSYRRFFYILSLSQKQQLVL